MNLDFNQMSGAAFRLNRWLGRLAAKRDLRRIERRRFAMGETGTAHRFERDRRIDFPHRDGR